MRVGDLVSKLDLKVLAMTKEGGLREVLGGFSGDILSNVMACAKPGQAWITAQTHENVVAVAAVVDASCVVVCQREVSPETVKRASSEGVTMLWSRDTAFEVAGRLWNLVNQG